MVIAKSGPYFLSLDGLARHPMICGLKTGSIVSHQFFIIATNPFPLREMLNVAETQSVISQ